MTLARLLLAYAAAAGLAAAQPADPAGERAGAQALPALIDNVLNDPSNPESRERLKSAAELASAREKKAIAAEKAVLLAGAERDRKKTLEMRAAKEKRRRAWNKAFARVCSLAADADNMREAVYAYEALLEKSPVYSDNGEELAAASEKVKKILYRTIKSEYPHLVEGRDRIDERDIASLLFYRASTQDDLGRYADTSSTQEALNKADRFRRLERELRLQHSNLTKGISLYTKRHYSEALALFEEVLAFDRANEEALYFWVIARGKTKSAAGDEAGE
ncbi:MAG: hypothetical protein Q7R35_15255 [Elusimicrobiota bacterium]|nr:hypothetical protein [Elusimicrobiota bacterium]